MHETEILKQQSILSVIHKHPWLSCCPTTASNTRALRGLSVHSGDCRYPYLCYTSLIKVTKPRIDFTDIHSRNCLCCLDSHEKTMRTANYLAQDLSPDYGNAVSSDS